jgi:hypothetical protein
MCCYKIGNKVAQAPKLLIDNGLEHIRRAHMH